MPAGRGQREQSSSVWSEVELAPADLDRVVEIERACFSRPWSLAEFHCAIADPEVLALGTCIDGQLVGYAIGYCRLPEFHLANLGVAPGIRRQGCATALLRTTLDRARLEGCSVCILEVRASNLPARALYAALGFSRVGVRAGYYQQPAEDALILMVRMEAFLGS